MRTLLSILLLSAAALLSNTAARAHGSTQPEHGGVVQMVGETVIELVVVDGGADIYLREEDEPLASAGMTGKLTVTRDGVKSQAALSAAGENKLQARGIDISAAANVSTRVSVQIVRADQSRINAVFSVK
jgi:hypothetical protein